LNTEAVDQSAGGEVEESDIPNAKEEKAAEQSTELGETTSEPQS